MAGIMDSVEKRSEDQRKDQSIHQSPGIVEERSIQRFMALMFPLLSRSEGFVSNVLDARALVTILFHRIVNRIPCFSATCLSCCEYQLLRMVIDFHSVILGNLLWD